MCNRRENEKCFFDLLREYSRFGICFFCFCFNTFLVELVLALNVFFHNKVLLSKKKKKKKNKEANSL